MLLRRPGGGRAFAVLGFLAAGFFWTEASSQKGVSASDAFRIAPSAAAQDYYWTRSFGTSNNLDSGYDIRQTQDGGFVVAGIIRMQWANFINYFVSRLWIIKLNPLGEVEWHKTLGDEESSNFVIADTARIRQTRDGGYVAATFIVPAEGGARDIWVLKLLPNGEIAWQRTYGGPGKDEPADISQTIDGGFIVAGSMFNINSDVWILKLDPQGNVEWQRVFDDAGDENAESVQQTEDGGYIVAGSKRLGGRYDCWVIKLNSLGAVEWQRTYGLSQRLSPLTSRIGKTREGGFILIYTTDILGAGGQDLVILKLSSTGAVEWQKAYGGGLQDFDASEIHQTPDGGYITAATTNSFRPGSYINDIWVLKLDPAGEIEWQKYYGTESKEALGNIIPANDGGFAFVGTTYADGAHKGDVFVGKIDAGGLGGSCEQGVFAQGVATSTSIFPMATNGVPMVREMSSQATSVTPADLNFDARLYCWNLHQPPESLSLTEKVNRGLFKREKYFLLQWMPNDFNRSFAIAEYRIYRYARLIASVPSSVFQYADVPLDAETRPSYSMTAVDTQGRESPRSVSVAK